jgi:iron complex outermembrane recepter protein
VELERIEVLRGPQGTYFGKNAIGGAIQYITQKPRDEFGARIRATLGDFNRTDIIANVDIPVSRWGHHRRRTRTSSTGSFVP